MVSICSGYLQTRQCSKIFKQKKDQIQWKQDLFRLPSIYSESRYRLRSPIPFETWTFFMVWYKKTSHLMEVFPSVRLSVPLFFFARRFWLDTAIFVLLVIKKHTCRLTTITYGKTSNLKLQSVLERRDWICGVSSQSNTWVSCQSLE